jgi:hypothetical protein
MARCWEHGKRLLGSIRGGKFLKQLRSYARHTFMGTTSVAAGLQYCHYIGSRISEFRVIISCAGITVTLGRKSVKKEGEGDPKLHTKHSYRV